MLRIKVAAPKSGFQPYFGLKDPPTYPRRHGGWLGKRVDSWMGSNTLWHRGGRAGRRKKSPTNLSRLQSDHWNPNRFWHKKRTRAHTHTHADNLSSASVRPRAMCSVAQRINACLLGFWFSCWTWSNVLFLLWYLDVFGMLKTTLNLEIRLKTPTQVGFQLPARSCDCSNGSSSGGSRQPTSSSANADGIIRWKSGWACQWTSETAADHFSCHVITGHCSKTCHVLKVAFNLFKLWTLLFFHIFIYYVFQHLAIPK